MPHAQPERRDQQGVGLAGDVWQHDRSGGGGAIHLPSDERFAQTLGRMVSRQSHRHLRQNHTRDFQKRWNSVNNENFNLNPSLWGKLKVELPIITLE